MAAYGYTQSDAAKKLAKKIIAKQEMLATKRVNWESHWQEILDYVVPRKAEVNVTRTPGDKRNADLFDSTAIMANQLLAGALHGMLTNPSSRFFDLEFSDPRLMADETVRAWLQEVATRMFHVLNNTNFQTEIHEIYLDLGAIGTACLYMGEHEENILHFASRPIKEIFVAENNLGLIDTVHRVFKWDARQIIQEFGEDKVPEAVTKAYQQGSMDQWCIIHAVEPSDAYYDEEKAKKEYFKIKSCYVLKEHNYILSEGGYNEFPYAVPRWTKTSGEVYGRGPGTDMLPDIKMIDKMKETTLKGAQKTVDPPLMVQDEGVIGNVRLTPGGLTVVRPGLDAAIQPLITNSRVDFGFQLIEAVGKQIKSGFYVDQLQLDQNDRMTQLEVQQRINEKLRLMGPVLSRQHFEFLNPVIERVFAVMTRRKLLPPAPQIIQGKKFQVRYSSLVARAQRMSEGQTFMQAIQIAAPIAQADPTVLDNLNGDEALKYIFEVYDVPMKLVRKKAEVQKIREGRAEAQAKLAKEQENEHAAEVVGKVAPAEAQLQQAENARGR